MCRNGRDAPKGAVLGGARQLARSTHSGRSPLLSATPAHVPQPPFSLRASGSSGEPPLARRFRYSFYRAILLLGLDREAE
jgi:hypothetical protein